MTPNMTAVDGNRKQIDRSELALTVLRRSLFSLALLGTGSAVAIATGFYHDKWGHPDSLRPGYRWWVSPTGIMELIGLPGLPFDRMFGTLLWGADTLGVVLAVWLVGRYGWHKNWSGRVRGTLYVFAFGYGAMLFSATQRWLNQLLPNGLPQPDKPGQTPFRWPGREINDYGPPAIDLLALLFFICLLLPILAVSRHRLVDRQEGVRSSDRSFSIASALKYTAAVALVLGWIRFLCWRWVAPDSIFSSMEPGQAVAVYASEFAPGYSLTLGAALLIAVGWSGGWGARFGAFIGAVILTVVGHAALYWILENSSADVVGDNPLHSGKLEAWCYSIGCSLAVWVAFGVAHFTGVRFRRIPADHSPLADASNRS